TIRRRRPLQTRQVNNQRSKDIGKRAVKLVDSASVSSFSVRLWHGCNILIRERRAILFCMIEKSMLLLSWPRGLVLGVLAALVVLFSSDAVPAQSTCDNVKTLALPNTTITLAQTYPANSEVAPGQGNSVAICRVVAHISPSSDSDILIEMWL